MPPAPGKELVSPPKPHGDPAERESRAIIISPLGISFRDTLPFKGFKLAYRLSFTPPASLKD